MASAPESDLLGEVVTESSDKAIEHESPSLHATVLVSAIIYAAAMTHDTADKK